MSACVQIQYCTVIEKPLPGIDAKRHVFRTRAVQISYMNDNIQYDTRTVRIFYANGENRSMLHE